MGLGLHHGEVGILLLGDMQDVGGDLHDPAVRDNHPGAGGTCGKLVNAAEFGVDGGSHGPPAGLGQSMRP